MIPRFFTKELQEKIETLEKRTAELEKENEKLRKRLFKRKEKIESQPALYQETAEELKRAKTVIESLENKIQALTDEKDNKNQKTSIQNFSLSKKESLDFLEKIQTIKSQSNTFYSVYLTPNETELLRNYAGGDIFGDEIIDFADGIKSETGLIGFFDSSPLSVACFFSSPPFPPKKSEIFKDSIFLTKQAEDIFSKNRQTAFILAHAGESVIGIASESGLIKSELIKTGVKEKHSKGGWSQKRFERLREEDIRRHIEKAGESFKELLAEYKGITDEIIISGDKKTGFDIAGYSGDEFKDINRIYRHFDTKPDRYAGEKLAKDIWSARWYRL
ncbi:hypothetical protein L1994_00380 [Methanomicrobium antiquum]|uniref:Actinobacteria/chloroflexi VLRF1 release factor domain-containing protein n=1 Tax=Methanomicrobium antiquum TaxID=487686 RepID=A0AAF0FVW9_9EURY|nr:Vms1/Ankzf1 family peptidyl-tRNA hydrolase [Methanomicrobium antiquum]WFN36890.1 hypothetical protein L1994_00380 [Methanomicrobium antiquum]